VKNAEKSVLVGIKGKPLALCGFAEKQLVSSIV